MIPNKNSPYYKEAKYSILEVGDLIEETDEYYNPIKDRWMPVQKDFVGQVWSSDESKPVRRKIEKKSVKKGKVKSLEDVYDDLEKIRDALSAELSPLSDNDMLKIIKSL